MRSKFKKIIDKIKENKNINLILLVPSAASLLYFIFFSYKKYFFNSDSASKVLLAKEIFETGEYFPKEWIYVNGDITTLFGHTYIIPLLKIMPAGYLSHSLSGLISIALIIISINLLAKTLNPRNQDLLILNLIVLSGVSLPITEHLFGQVSYGYSLYAICFILWATIRVINDQGRILHIGIIVFFTTVNFWSNPKRAIITIGVPLLLSVLISENKVKSSYKFYLYTSISMIVGAFLYFITIQKVSMNIGYTTLVWLNIQETIDRIGKLFGGILFLLGGEPLKGRNVLTLVGIYEFIRIITAVIFIYLTPYCIKAVYRLKSRSIKLLMNFILINFIVTSFFLLFTNLFDERYLIVSTSLFLIILFTTDFKNEIKLTKKMYFSLRFIVVIGLCTNSYVINTKYWHTYDSITAQRVNFKIHRNLDELMEVLNINELTYGYATYWRSSLITVLSDEKIKVRPIGFVDGYPSPDYYLTSKKWYSCSKNIGKVFIILVPEELDLINLNMLSKNGYEVSQVIKSNDYTILVFERNFCDLKNWNK